MSDDEKVAKDLVETLKDGERGFRTAAEKSVLPGRVSEALLSQWRYAEEKSRTYLARDRSAIYGGFHLYVKA